MNLNISHRTAFIGSYILDIVVCAIIVSMLYIFEFLDGNSLLPFSFNSVDLEVFIFYFVALVLVVFAIFVHFLSLKFVQEREVRLRYRYLALLDIVPAALSVPLWLFTSHWVIAFACVSLSGLKLLTDCLIFLKSDFSRIFLLFVVLLLFVVVIVSFAFWGKLETSYNTAKRIVDQCEMSTECTLPSTAWSVALYSDGNLVYSDGRFRFPPQLPNVANRGHSDFARSFYRYTEQFYFFRGETVYVVGCSSWPNWLTLGVNISIIFFIYVALCILSYWIYFLAARRRIVIHSFFTRLRVSILFFVLGSIVAVLIFTSWYVFRSFINANKYSLTSEMSIFVDIATPMLDSDDFDAARKEILRTDRYHEPNIALYDNNGRLMFTSDSLYDVESIDIPANFSAMQSDVEARLVRDYSDHIKLQAYGIIRTSHYHTYYAVMWSDAKSAYVRQTISFYVIILLSLFFVFVIVAVAFSYGLSHRLARPVKKIYQCLSTFTLGGVNNKIDYEVEGNDELALLIRNYNGMVDKLDASASELAMVERENSWRDMSRHIAHEIKNPLTPMRLILQQMMLYRGNDVEELKRRVAEHASILLVQVDSLYETACSLSDFARRPMQCKEPVDMIEKARHIYDLFRHNDIDARLEVVIAPDADDAHVFIDKNLALRLFSNLVRNAIQAIPDNRSGEVRIEVSTNDTEVIVAVIDNGIGMDTDVIDRIFDTNFTTKTKGMGLGLRVVKDIVKDSDGTIVVESSPDIGSKFTITWPRFKGEKRCDNVEEGSINSLF